MPYIDQRYRDGLDAGDALPGTLGELNYVITTAVLDWLPSDPCYADYNAAIGVLECAKLELYRRLVVPFEDKKCAAHGDVYMYK